MRTAERIVRTAVASVLLGTVSLGCAAKQPEVKEPWATAAQQASTAASRADAAASRAETAASRAETAASRAEAAAKRIQDAAAQIEEKVTTRMRK